MESPIQKAIEEVLSLRSTKMPPSHNICISHVHAILIRLLPYEASRDRKIADDAWDAAIDTTCVFKSPDKQTYLKLNCPL